MKRAIYRRFQSILYIFLVLSLALMTLLPAFSWPVFAEQAVVSDTTAPTAEAQPSEPAPVPAVEPEPVAAPDPIAAMLLIPSGLQTDGGGGESMLLSGGAPDPLGEYGPSRAPLKPSFNVKAEEATGALVYSYPVEIPKGRAGLQPDLHLTYNSYDTKLENIISRGWSLSIPSIERLPKAGVAEMFSANDFTSSLDGELVNLSGNQYAARTENGNFTKYEFTSNTWVATDKKGVVYSFGLNAATRQDDPGDASRIFKWMLEKVIDTNGNYITYTYQKTNGQIYPLEIRYTGFDADPGAFRVEFIWQNRSDVVSTRDKGFEVTTGKRVQNIFVYYQNAWVQKYTSVYTTADNGTSSAVSSIQREGRDSQGVITQLPLTTFSYHSAGTKDWTQDNNYIIPEILVGQFGMDPGTRLADVNGDGLVDILRSSYQGPTPPGYPVNRVNINKGDGTGWQLDPNWVVPERFSVEGGGVFYDQGTRLVDVNGDGLVDVMRSSYDTFGIDTIQRVYINTGSGWQLDSNYQIPTYFTYGNNRQDYGVRFGVVNGVRLVDINGDGLADVIRGDYQNPDGFVSRVYINKGDGTGWAFDSTIALPD